MSIYRLMTKFWQFSRPLPLAILKSIWYLPSSDSENQGDIFLKECVNDTKILNHVQSSKIMILSERKHESSFMMRNTTSLIWKKWYLLLSRNCYRAVFTENAHRVCKNTWFLYACMLCSHPFFTFMFAYMYAVIWYQRCKSSEHSKIQIQFKQTFEKWHNIC